MTTTPLSKAEVDAHLVVAQNSMRYCLLRRIFIAQLNGNYEPGEKFQALLGGDDEPKTEEEFDARIDRALQLMTP